MYSVEIRKKSIIYYAEIKEKIITAYYIEDIHGEELCKSILVKGGIVVDEELHQYLLTLGEVEFTGIKEDRIYTLLDKSLFNKVEIMIDSTQQPSQEERISALETALMGVL